MRDKKEEILMKKNGISPLIATVLILGFTVALAAIIMTWGTGFVKKMQESTEETANIQVVCATDVVFNVKSACWGDDEYNVVISNDGKTDIIKWRFRIYYSDTNVTSSAEIIEPILKFGLQSIPIGDNNATMVQGAKKIEAIPIIKPSGTEITCAQNIDSYGDTTGSEISICS